jgi:hypothetical protein
MAKQTSEEGDGDGAAEVVRDGEGGIEGGGDEVNLKTTLAKHLFPYTRAFLSESPLFKVRKVHAVIHRKKKLKTDFIIQNTGSGMYEKEHV